MAISEVRARIDRIDEEIVKLLARRQKLVREAARFKADQQAVRAPDRRSAMMIRLQELAAQHGVSSDVVHRTYTAMIDAFIDLELQEHALIDE
jgi:isochorismate pyruvate lyase